MQSSKFIPEHFIFAFCFFLPPLLTLTFAKILFELLVFNFIDLNQALIHSVTGADGISLTVKLNEMKARLLWVTSVLVYIFIMAGFTVFIVNTLKSLKKKSTILFFIFIAIIVFLVEAGYLLTVESAQSPIVSIFRFTFDALTGSGLYTSNQLHIIESTLDVINLFGLLAVPFGLMAGCSIMFDIPPAEQREAEYFLGRSIQLKKLTMGGSAFMVIGVMHMQLWLNWPLSFIEGSTEIALLKSVTLSICQYWGVSYSLIIAALYIPAAHYLSEQAKLALLRGRNEELKKDPENWLIKNKLMFSPLASLPQIIAVIAPMLVGSFGSSLSGLVYF